MIQLRTSGRALRRGFGHPIAALSVYGLILAIVTAFALNAHLPAPSGMYLQGDRLDGARIAIRSINHGGTVLVGKEANVAQSPEGCRADTYCVVGVADDPGFYVYDAYVSHLAGQNDPRVVLRDGYIALFALLIALSPLAFFALTGSLASAVIAPLLIDLQMRFLDNTDIYWISGWVLVLLLPGVFATYRLAWTRRSVVALTAISVIASWATSIRLDSGLPVAIAAVIIALLRQPGRVKKLAVAALLVAAYLSVYPLAFQPIFHARDVAAKKYNATPQTPPGVSLSDVYPDTHLTWHNMYIGLGYLPNKFGIRWADIVGLEHAERFDPHVVFLSKRYDLDERHLFFQVLRKDPGLVARNIETKTRFEVGQAMSRFGWAFLFLPIIFGFGRSRRREFALYLALMVPALVITLAPPVLTVPILFYSVGFYGAAALVWFVTVTWFVGITAPELVRDFRRWYAAGRPLALRRTNRRLQLTFATLGLALIAIAFRPPIEYAGISAAGFSALVPSPLSPPPSGHGSAVHTWTFAHSLPAGWTAASSGVKVVVVQHGVSVRTTSPHFNYELLGPTFALAKGTYELRLHGSVKAGGLDLGLLSTGSDQWLAQSGYLSSQNFARGDMVTRFNLSRATTVRPILSNWRPSDGVSVWVLYLVELQSVEVK